MANTMAAELRAKGHTCEGRPDAMTLTPFLAPKGYAGLYAGFTVEVTERFASACKKCQQRKAPKPPAYRPQKVSQQQCDAFMRQARYDALVAA